MNRNERLKQAMETKEKLIINGIPEEGTGIINEVHEDYIVFTVEPDENHTETIEVLIKDIGMISRGPKQKQTILQESSG